MAGIFNVKSLDTNHVTPVTEKPAPRDPKLDREFHHRQPEGCQSSPPGDPKFNSSLPEKWGVGRRSFTFSDCLFWGAKTLTTSREYAQTATASVPRDGATAPLRHPELLFSSKVNEVRILEVFAVVWCCLTVRNLRKVRWTSDWCNQKK